MKRWFAGLALIASFATAEAAELKVNDPAPLFELKNHEGKAFDLKSRAGQWTVLYFYPKADTPGCTKQACAFRDNIKKIRAQGAEVYGISADTVEKQASFHKGQKLNFDLLADPEAKVIEQYGTKMPMMAMSKRWTFIVSPELKIASIDKDVDPVVDSEKIAGKIAALKKK
ncbi:peroxiredoxin [Oligoflexus tunisiensis]|uniref:peroxiredoxin n=1 Tax=Oligoflexus tunisiensis TaxID=708132 RepID=UPI000A9B48C5|nr:peroxiredoxin [Oligoflexus tunisiensis]